MMMTKKQTNIQNNTGYSIFHGSERREEHAEKATAMHATGRGSVERGEEASDGAESPPGHSFAGCWPSSRA
jgi:hypothetical protein